MKSILYGLLLNLVPDLATLQVGLVRRSGSYSSVYSLSVEVLARRDSMMVCAVSRCNSDQLRDDVMRLLVDVAGHAIRPLDLDNQIETMVAGDCELSVDDDVELTLCLCLMHWLMSAIEQGQEFDSSATSSGGVDTWAS